MFDARAFDWMPYGTILVNTGRGEIVRLDDLLQAGVSGTPSFLLGYTEAGGTQIKAVTFIRGAQGFDVLKENIDKLLTAKK